MKRPGSKPKVEVDLRLAVLCAVNPPGHAWSGLDLAEFLGLHHSRVQQIEEGALKKLRTRVTVMTAILEEQGLTYRQCRPRVNK